MDMNNRLEMCKKAVLAQITQMHASNNQRKLGLVTFENQIEIIGDGVEKPITLDPNTLYDYDAILAQGLEQADLRMRQPISETKENLMQRVSAVHTKGATSMGPAVLASVAMASKGAAGSQVIILTDGMSNRGIGSFRGGPNQHGEA